MPGRTRAQLPAALTARDRPLLVRDRLEHVRLRPAAGRSDRREDTAEAGCDQVGEQLAGGDGDLEALSDPQALAREMVVEVEHASVGASKTLGVPVKLSDTPGSVRRAAPRLGEHTAEVLAEVAGLSTPEASVAAHQNPLPLAGVRVLDLSMFFAGRSVF